jgi:ferredoxin
MNRKIFIAFISPAGSTRKAAQMLEDECRNHGTEPRVLDLAAADEQADFLQALRAAGPDACLFIGSPVYRDLAVPPVIRFILQLPPSPGAWAVPFATWGGACSGLALWQMGSLLAEKGFVLAAAAKVLAEHAMMWRATHPLGQGRPDGADAQALAGLVAALLRRPAAGAATALALEALDYQPPARGAEIKSRLGSPFKIIPKTLHRNACTQCGVCEEVCPAAAVRLAPYPEFDSNCFDCFNCVRLCPTEAIEPTVRIEDIEAHIRSRAEKIQETPPTAVFLPALT